MTTASSANEQYVGSEHVKSEFAQDVKGSAKGPAKGNEAPPQINAVIVMKMFNAFQDRLENIEVMMGQPATDNNPPVAPPTVCSVRTTSTASSST